MRLYFLLALAVGIPSLSFAQAGSVSGCLKDTIGEQSLAGATVLLLAAKDSVSIRVGEDARFNMARCPLGNYLVRVTFEGYQPWQGHILLSEGHPRADLGDIYLSPRIDQLDSIRIAPPPLVVLKKDTTEYNTGNVKMRKYAVLQDLLQKLPGVELDVDGSLKVNGERVDELLVNGVPFFGGDPATALQNLPAEIIDKLQVYKARSDKELATGFKFGSGKQTLNVVIKKDRMKGTFGKAGGGGGSQGVYAGGVNLNRFDGARQVSLIGSAADVGNDGNPLGSPSGMPWSGQPMVVTHSFSTGINYRDNWDKHIQVYGSYLYGDRNSRTTEVVSSQNLFPGDSTTNNFQTGSSHSKGNNQAFSFGITAKPDSLNIFIFRPGFTFRHNESDNATVGTLTGIDPEDTLYTSTGRFSSKSDSRNFSGDLSWSHRFPQSASILFTEMRLSQRSDSSVNFSNTQTTYLSPAAYASGLDQEMTRTTYAGVVNPSLSFTHPIDLCQTLEADYNFTWAPTQARNLISSYDKPDSAQKTNLRYIDQTQVATLAYSFQTLRWNLSAGLGFRFDVLQEPSLSRPFKSLVPAFHLEYDFNPDQRMEASYSGSAVPLDIQQLQPIAITLDSLNIQKGNPLLRQPYTHTFLWSYRARNPTSMRVFSANLTANATSGTIQTSVSQLAGGIQVSQPVNLGSSFSTSLTLSYGVPVKPLHSIFTLGGQTGYNQTPDLLNGILSRTGATSVGASLSSSTTIAGRLDFVTGSSIVYNAYHYTFQPTTDFTTVRVTGNIRYYSGNWTFSTSARYIFNSSLPPGFERSVLLLSPAISLRMFKNKAGEIRFFLSDLLNRQSGVTRSVTPSSVSQTESQVQGRYGLLSFVYDMRYFPQKK